MASGQTPEAAMGTGFGETAETYDAARPGYPDELVSRVLDYARLEDREAVEIGAGTGKATVAFAARGIRLSCVEPDPRMAAVLRRNTAGFPRVRIDVERFEDRRPDDRRFGLLIAATSWHWLDPRRRWDLAHGALAPGGALAVFWNPHGVLDARLHARLAEIDHRNGVADSPHGTLASAYGEEPGDWGGEPGWPEPECRADGRFTDLRAVRFRDEPRYDTDRYLGYLTSVSAYRVLPAERRRRALDETARLLDTNGGGIDMCHITDLFLARAR